MFARARAKNGDLKWSDALDKERDQIIIIPAHTHTLESYVCALGGWNVLPAWLAFSSSKRGAELTHKNAFFVSVHPLSPQKPDWFDFHAHFGIPLRLPDNEHTRFFTIVLIEKQSNLDYAAEYF